MEMVSAFFFAYSAKPAAEFRISRRAGKEWLPQRAQVETRSSGEDRAISPALNFLNRLGGGAGPVAGREVHFRWHEVNQMMRDAATLCDRDFCRGDLNALVDLHRIAVDDLAADRQRDCDRQVAFARSRRPDDGGNRAIALRVVTAAGRRRVVWKRSHPRLMISRIAIVSQMSARMSRTPITCAREKRMCKGGTPWRPLSRFVFIKGGGHGVPPLTITKSQLSLADESAFSEQERVQLFV